MDFIGYTTGKSIPPAGLRGIMDFIGYPVGKGEAVEPPQPSVPYRPRGGVRKKKQRKDNDDEELLLLM